MCITALAFMVCHGCGSEAPEWEVTSNSGEADFRLARIGALMEELTRTPATSARHPALIEELRVDAIRKHGVDQSVRTAK